MRLTKYIYQTFVNTFNKKSCFFILMLFLLISNQEVYSQEKATVKGVVTDKSGKPLTGVNVAVMGSPGGMATR